MFYMMSSNQNDGGEEEKKTVTIRGIDKKLYEMATETARKTGKTVGEVVNESLRLFLAATGEDNGTGRRGCREDSWAQGELRVWPQGVRGRSPGNLQRG
jgi:hypothetical protein